MRILGGHGDLAIRVWGLSPCCYVPHSCSVFSDMHKQQTSLPPARVEVRVLTVRSSKQLVDTLRRAGGRQGSLRAVYLTTACIADAETLSLLLYNNTKIPT